MEIIKTENGYTLPVPYFNSIYYVDVTKDEITELFKAENEEKFFNALEEFVDELYNRAVVESLKLVKEYLTRKEQEQWTD